MNRFVRIALAAAAMGLSLLGGRLTAAPRQIDHKVSAMQVKKTGGEQLPTDALRERVRHLVKALRLAWDKDRPKDALKAIEALTQIAEQQHATGSWLWLTEQHYRWASRVDDDAARGARAAAYRRMAGQPWLTPQARALVLTHALRFYAEDYAAVRFDLAGLRPTDGAGDETFPFKSTEGYRQHCLALLEQIERLAPLSSPTSAFAPWQELEQAKVWRTSKGWSGTLAAVLFEDREALSGLIREQTLQILERYSREAPNEVERMHAEWRLLPLKLQTKAEDYLAFLARHEQRHECYPYLVAALDRAYDTYSKAANPRLHVAHLERLLALGWLNKQQQAELKASKERLLSPSLYAGLPKRITVPARRKTALIVTHSFMPSVRVEAFRVPHILHAPEQWEPKAGDSPVWTKTFALEQDPDWRSKRDTLLLDLHRTGHYRLHISSPDHKNLRTNQPYLIITNQVAYAPPQGAGAARVQWLDAETGAPLAARSFAVWQNDWGQHKKPQMQRIASDALGIVPLPEAQKSWGINWRVRLEDPEDPISTSIYNTVEEASEQSRTEIALTTERAVYAQGQRLHLYGYVGQQARRIEQARVLSALDLRLSISSPNGKELMQSTLRTDHLGRFTLDYDLPRGALLGAYTIACKRLDGQAGYAATSFRLEAYQKPTFELVVTPPTEALRLGDSIRLPMVARLLTGTPLAGTRIEVEATVSRFRPRGWYYIDRRSEQLPLLQLTTGTDGTASLPFTFLPLEDDVDDKPNPRGDFYDYSLRIRAIAPTGETTEEQLRLSVGREPASIGVEMPEYIEATAPSGTLTFTSHGHGGNAISQEVAYSIGRAEAEGQVLRSGLATTNSPIALSDLLAGLPSGRYHLGYKPQAAGTNDNDNQWHTFRLYRQTDKTLPEVQLLEAFAPSNTYEGGTLPSVYLGTALEDTYIYYQVKCDEELLPTRLLRPARGRLTPLPLGLGKRQSERIGVLIWLAHRGRIEQRTLDFTRRTPSRALDIEVRSFRDRTTPGANEEVSVRISQAGKPIRAALASWMYDEALEQIAPLEVYPLRATPLLPAPIGSGRPLISARRPVEAWDSPYAMEASEAPIFGYAMDALEGVAAGVGEQSIQEVVVRGLSSKTLRAAKMLDAPEAARPAVRGDFAETAFFRPMLTTDAEGLVRWTYRVPDNLTRWRLCLLAHTEDLSAGYQTRQVEVYRPLMVKPYLPRLLRLGDEASLAAALSNQVETRLEGECVLELFAPTSGRVLQREVKPFALDRGEQTALRFDITAPSALDSVGVRLTAVSGAWSDGEQHLLPIVPAVLPTMRTESITIDEAGTTTLSLGGLFPATGFIPEEGSIDIRLETHPILLALESLPTASKPQSKDALSLSAALQASVISGKVLQIPGLMTWLEARAGRQAGSGLRTERDSLLLSPTDSSPWSGSLAEEERKRIEALRHYFETLRSDSSATLTEGLIGELAKQQSPNGSWSWYPGMRPSPYVTLMVMRQLVRASRLASVSGLEPILRKGWQSLAAQLRSERQEMLAYERKHRGQRAILSGWAIDVLYLLALSHEAKPASVSSVVLDFFYGRLRAEAHQLPLTSKPIAAVALMHRDRRLALDLLESLRQHLSTGRGGLYYANLGTRSYWWLNRLYPMQTATIEALLSLAPTDTKTLTGLQRWLLEQKRSVRWESTLATSEAIYALTLGTTPSDLTAVRRARLELTSSAGQHITAEGERPSIAHHWRQANSPQRLKITTESGGVTWGIASARYSLPITEDTSSGRELRATRRYYRRIERDGRQELTELRGGETLSVGDVLVVRLEIELERAIDFVRLSDPRLVCAEGRGQTSGYTYSPEARVSYYLERRDEETNFYFDQLDRGRYTLEYEQSIVRPGVYLAAAAHVQSVYAPEYSASTGFGGRITVQP